MRGGNAVLLISTSDARVDLQELFLEKDTNKWESFVWSCTSDGRVYFGETIPVLLMKYHSIKPDPAAAV